MADEFLQYTKWSPELLRQIAKSLEEIIFPHNSMPPSFRSVIRYAAAISLASIGNEIEKATDGKTTIGFPDPREVWDDFVEHDAGKINSHLP